jgi:hypothetical protein
VADENGKTPKNHRPVRVPLEALAATMKNRLPKRGAKLILGLTL